MKIPIKGGSWSSNPGLCLSVFRGRNLHNLQIRNLGFRILLRKKHEDLT